MMMLAVIYLCAWDYHRIRSVFTEKPWPASRPVPELRLDWLERTGFLVFAASLLMFFGATRSFVSPAWNGTLMLIGFLAGLATLLRFRRRPDRGA